MFIVLAGDGATRGRTITAVVLAVPSAGTRCLPTQGKAHHQDGLLRREYSQSSGTSGGRSAGGEKLVAIDLGGYANAAVSAGIDSNDLPAAADIHFSGRRNFLR